MNKEELLEYARKHYPIGTQYVPVHVDMGINEVVDTDYNYDGGSTEYIHVKNKHIENSFSGCIYKDGKWAKIVSKPEEKIENLYPKKYSLGKIKFKDAKPGDSIPYYYTDCDGILEELIVHGSTKLHESYKYAEIVNYHKEFYLVKYLDYNNKYVTLGFEEESLEPYVEEVKENPKSLIGRYLKCLKTNSWGNGKTAIGEYLKITDADNYGDFVINNTGTWFSRNRIERGEYELMPEGFEPNKVEEKWIPKVGDWVVSLVDRPNYRKKGDVFQVLKVCRDCIYYAKNTNGSINTFRPAEPHEIPKENKYIIGVDPIKETKPEIDSWCIQLTEENRELLLQNKHVFKASWNFDNIGSYYGFNKSNNSWCSGDKDSFDKVLTTEEFCKKFNITESYKWVELDFNKLVNTGAIQYKEEEIKIQVKKSKTIKI